MIKKVLFLTLMIIGLFTGSAFAVDLTFDGYIADQANLLSPESKENLNYTLHDLNKKTTATIALVTVSTLKGEKIEKMASDIMGEYKIGDEKKDNGLVFLISIGERQLQVILGDGLVDSIEPKTLENIIDKNVLPYFEAGQYENGVLRGTYLMADMVADIDGKKVEHFGVVPDNIQIKKPFNKNWLWLLLIPLVAVIAVIIVKVEDSRKNKEQNS